MRDEVAARLKELKGQYADQVLAMDLAARRWQERVEEINATVEAFKAEEQAHNRATEAQARKRHALESAIWELERLLGEH